MPFIKSNRDEMLSGLGESEVTLDTYLEAAEDSEGTITDAGDEPTPAPADLPAADQAEPSAPPAAPALPEGIDNFDEYRKSIEAQQQAYFEQMQKRLDSQLAQLKPQQPSEDPYQFEDPVSRLQREVEELRKGYSDSQQHLEKMRSDNFRAEHERAVNSLREKYPDLDEFVPPSMRDSALKQAIEGKHYSVNWKDAIAQVYKINSHDKYHSASQKQSDELSSKREQKRQSSMQAASAVAPGGSPFQAPAERLDPLSKSYDAERRRAFQRGLGVG